MIRKYKQAIYHAREKKNMRKKKLGLTNYEETFETNRINQLDQG